MHRAFILLPCLALGKISGTKNRFVPDCESGGLDVADIDEFAHFLNEENHVWKPSLNHHWGGIKSRISIFKSGIYLTPRLPLVHFWVNGWVFANLDSKTWSKGPFIPSHPNQKVYCGSRSTYKYSGAREKYTGKLEKLDVWKTVCENGINRGTEMGHSRSRKPNLIFVFNKNGFKSRFRGPKKDCTSQDSNPGPQH